MATRATYEFQTGLTTSTVYIHWDGYLSGAAHYFNEALKLRGGNADEVYKEYKRDIFACFVWANDQATMTDSHEAHGDTDYQYDVSRYGGEWMLVARKRVSCSSDEFEVVYDGELADFIDQYLTEEDEA